MEAANVSVHDDILFFIVCPPRETIYDETLHTILLTNIKINTISLI